MRLIDADATIEYLLESRCKDCDRRKGMKNGKIRFCYEIGDAPCRACDIADTIDYILDEAISPTIEAEPVRHGHWIDKPTGRYGNWQSYCSACGKHSQIGGIESNRHKPRCPWCGAFMDEVIK